MATVTLPTRLSYGSQADWLAGRVDGLGASDSAAIFGEGYADQSPLTVWESKVYPERAPNLDNVKRIRVGRLIEPALRAIFEDETNLPLAEAEPFTILRHPDIPWLRASLDAEVADPRLPVELKNVDSFLRKDWTDDSDPPLKFQIQCQHQLAVTGADRGYLMALVGGNLPVVKIINRNERFIASMIRKLSDFWGYVQSGTLPPMDDREATGKVLARLWPQDNGMEVLLPSEAAKWSFELEEAKATIKAAEKEKLAAENKLKAAIGEATFGVIPGGGRYSWKQQTRAGHYVEESEFRVLRKLKG